MKGLIVASSTIDFQIPTTTTTTNINATTTNENNNNYDIELLNNWNTVLLFSGMNTSNDFRLTELRVWNCLRDESDVKSFMHEHLSPAEMKNKFKVRMRNRTRTTTSAANTNNLIAALPKIKKPIILQKRNFIKNEFLNEDNNDDDQDFASLFDNRINNDSIETQ